MNETETTTNPATTSNNKPINPRSRIFRPCLTCRRRKISADLEDSAIRPDPNARDARKPDISAKDTAKNAISSMSSQPDPQLHQTVAEAAAAVGRIAAATAKTLTTRKKSHSDPLGSYHQNTSNNNYGIIIKHSSFVRHTLPVRRRSIHQPSTVYRLYPTSSTGIFPIVWRSKTGMSQQ
ncbi:hypothetical protein TSTA_088310 [Talaromyces stipitatus ATCC 10500]|uniref:Uncharacterized protein n=1 Tax=Talaromyces stipitatus (strain ATCC 10500 / CBS 375.48 / QM 6759 / NRRL 1006) TaxID=441959 RepID=B8M2D1_TALSN|nr:uncharacterized protein TSTA_088310 [Talaromyces stipitatus ATCC 10500]EED21595.1 hypothetical protein TSTA_088310 [Talaromyces stipitatus ATCC 10500]